MFRKVTPETAIAVVKLSVFLTCCWPLKSTATKPWQLGFKLLRIILTLNALGLLLPLTYAMHVHRKDTENLAKAACMSIAALQVFLQPVIGVTEYDRLQRLIEELNSYCENATSNERFILQRYVDKYCTFYGACLAWFYTTTAALVFGNFLISDPFPTNAEYPFPVTFQPLRTIIFLQQSIVGVQCAAHISMNAFAALLMFFSAARFEILLTELRAAKDTESLVKCVEKYNTAKSYAEDTVGVIRQVVFLTVLLASVAAVFSGISIIARQPSAVKVQFIFVAAVSLLEVFMCSLPADRLMDISKNAMEGAYEIEWYDRSLRMRKDIAFLLIPRRPVIISIKCFIPALSLNYYCSYISNVFSLFTALRMVMVDEE